MIRCTHCHNTILSNIATGENIQTKYQAFMRIAPKVCMAQTNRWNYVGFCYVPHWRQNVQSSNNTCHLSISSAATKRYDELVYMLCTCISMIILGGIFKYGLMVTFLFYLIFLQLFIYLFNHLYILPYIIIRHFYIGYKGFSHPCN